MASVIVLFSSLIIFQANNSFFDPVVPASDEIKVTLPEARIIAERLVPQGTLTQVEYEIEQNKLYVTVTFADDTEVKVNMLTGEAHIPQAPTDLLGRLTDDFDEMVGWIALLVFVLSGLLCVYVAHQTLLPISRNMQKQKEFVSGAAHELRNPLAALHARIESALRSQEPDFKKNIMEDLFSQTKHLIAVSEGLLAFEKGEHKKMHIQDCSVSESITRIKALLKYMITEKQIEVKSDIEAEMLLIDKEDLDTILYNLMHNAVKFTQNEGIITVAWKKKTLTVSDTGIGIPEKDIPYIFDRFYKVDSARGSEGSGLGLALVKEIVEKYNGKIQVVSEEGRGTVFSILF